MNDPIYIPNHTALGIARLSAQFNDKPLIQGFVGAFTVHIQYLEDALFQMLTEMSVFNAIGAQLDIIGEIVGVPRRGFNDDTYRLFIFVQIGINTSQGKPDQIIAIMLLITGGTNCLYLPYYPAAMGLQVNVDLVAYLAGLPLSQASFQTLIEETIPAGVDLYPISCYNGPNNAFGFLEDLDALGYDQGEYATTLY